MIANLRNVSKKIVEEICEFTKLKEALKRKVSKYSMVMKQRLGLEISILSKPKFLILHEPTGSLNPTGIIHLINTLQRLIKEENISILLSSHEVRRSRKIIRNSLYK